MNSELSATEIKKICMALGAVLVLGISGLFARQKAEASRDYQHTIRQMSLEMGHKVEGNLSSPPEEEGQRSDPHFQP